MCVLVTEAKQTCRSYQTKYIELSAALNHRVDDLLAGIASQIRLNPARQARHLAGDTTAKPVNCISSAKGLIGRLFRKQTPASSSCENLLTLWAVRLATAGELRASLTADSTLTYRLGRSKQQTVHVWTKCPRRLWLPTLYLRYEPSGSL